MERAERRGRDRLLLLLPLVLSLSGAPSARMLFHLASILPCLRRHGITWSTEFYSMPCLKPSRQWHPPTKTHAYVLVLRADSILIR